MKNLLVLFFFIGMTFTSQAQVVSNDNSIVAITNTELSEAEKATEISTAILSPRDMKAKHNLCFADQVRDYIASNITYTDELRQIGFEGTVMVNVSIDDAGQITNYAINGDINNIVDSVVLAQFENFTRLDLMEEAYYGSRSISIPVSFSFDR